VTIVLGKRFWCELRVPDFSCNCECVIFHFRLLCDEIENAAKDILARGDVTSMMKFNCKCGFKTDSLNEAVDHAAAHLAFRLIARHNERIREGLRK